ESLSVLQFRRSSRLRQAGCEERDGVARPTPKPERSSDGCIGKGTFARSPLVWGRARPLAPHGAVPRYSLRSLALCARRAGEGSDNARHGRALYATTGSACRSGVSRNTCIPASTPTVSPL